MHSLLKLIERRLVADVDSGVDVLFAAGDTPKVAAFLNSYSYIVLRQDARSLEDVDYLMCDGILMAVAVSIWRRRRVRRLSFDMTGIAGSVFGACERRGISVAVIGSRPPEVERFVERVRQAFPAIRFAMYRHGYFAQKEWPDVAKAIDGSGAGVVLLGMGTPLQETFASYLKGALCTPATVFTCGGFVHQAADKGLHYYPPWVDRLHLRWLYRSIKEPYVRDRLLKHYLAFPLIFIRDILERTPGNDVS